MHSTATGIIYAATDLSNFLACPHLTQKSLAAARGGPTPPRFDDPGAEVLRQRGFEHEQGYLRRLEQDVGSVTTVGREEDFWSTTWGGTYLAVLGARLRVFEQRYELPSSEVHQALERGVLRDTADVSEWLFWVDLRSQLAREARA